MNVGVSFSLPQEQLQEIARVGEDPREDVRVGVGVVEFRLYGRGVRSCADGPAGSMERQTICSG